MESAPQDNPLEAQPTFNRMPKLTNLAAVATKQDEREVKKYVEQILAWEDYEKVLDFLDRIPTLDLLGQFLEQLNPELHGEFAALLKLKFDMDNFVPQGMYDDYTPRLKWARRFTAIVPMLLEAYAGMMDHYMHLKPGTSANHLESTLALLQQAWQIGDAVDGVNGISDPFLRGIIIEGINHVRVSCLDVLTRPTIWGKDYMELSLDAWRRALDSAQATLFEMRPPNTPMDDARMEKRGLQGADEDEDELDDGREFKRRLV